MEPSLDLNKDLEGMIRNQFLIQEQEIQDREAKLYKLEKELQETKNGSLIRKTSKRQEESCKRARKREYAM